MTLRLRLLKNPSGRYTTVLTLGGEPHADRPDPQPSRPNLERVLVWRGIEPPRGDRADYLAEPNHTPQ